jgi:hypothetical protein
MQWEDREEFQTQSGQIIYKTVEPNTNGYDYISQHKRFQRNTKMVKVNLNGSSLGSIATHPWVPPTGNKANYSVLVVICQSLVTASK